MKSLVDELLDYFNNTPKEQIKEDWKAIHKEFAYGMEVHEFIEESRKLLFSGLSAHKVYVKTSFSGNFGKEFDLSKAA